MAAKVKLEPLGDRIVVKPVAEEQRTPSGIIIPDTAKEKPQEGEVVAVGKGRVDDHGNRIAPELKVGDHVLYAKYGGSEIKVNGEEFMILRESDVLAKRV